MNDTGGLTIWLRTCGRALNTAFFGFTAVYCVLTFSPFAYEQFIQPHVIAWLANFVFLYAYFYWLALCVTALSLVPVMKSRVAPFAWAYLAIGAAVGIGITIHPVLPAGNSAAHSLAIAFASLAPLFWLGAIDHGSRVQFADSSKPYVWQPDLLACGLTAVFVWATYAVLAAWRLWRGALIDSAGALAMGITISAVVHLTAAVIVYLALCSLHRLFEAEVGRRWLAAARVVVFSAAAAFLLRRIVLLPIAVNGVASWALAAGLGAALVYSISGMAQLHSHRPRSRRAAVSVVLLLPAAGVILLNSVDRFDWGFMLQKLSALTVAAAACAAFHTLVRGRSGGPTRTDLGVPVVVTTLFVACTVTAPRLPIWLHDDRLDPTFALDAYAAGDPSFRVIRELLYADGLPQTGADFFSFLRANTSIHEAVGPVPIDFVKTFESVQGPNPNVFVFVVDSLRRDYLSPYNPAVTFTPALDAFARQSYAFERAFTRYGGTGLAVPSIWAGSMLLHRQYVTPFAPMNAIAKLFDAHHYRRIMSVNHISAELFGFPESVTQLNRGVPEMSHTMCGTLEELESDLDAHRGDPRPVFGYARSLDLHIGNTRFAPVPAGERYPGFFEPYAARVRRLDACLGRFTTFLRHTGLWDNSIVIVVSDHGDSLGEGMRWGHGYTVFPEVIRIPLLVHLPPTLGARTTTDVARVAFTTDITPTLYALLGESPEPPRLEAGSPLFALGTEALTGRRHEAFVVASSYGAVYGLVRENGGRLYIADAVDGRDYLFDLSRPGEDVRIGITDAERLASRALIREQVADLAAWYGRQ